MENLSFNIFDAVVIGLIVLLSIKGLLSGFTKELFNAIGLIGGLFVASYYKKDLAQYAHNNFIDSISMPLLELLSLLIIFITILVVSKVIYKIIESFSNKEYISGASRLGGMLVKMVTLFFIFSLIIFGLSSKPQVVNKFKDTLDSSKLYTLLKNSGSAILNAPTLINGTNVEVDSKVDKKESNTTKEDNNTENKVAPAVKVESNNTTKKEDNTTAIESNNTDINIKKESNTSLEKVIDNNSSEANITQH